RRGDAVRAGPLIGRGASHDAGGEFQHLGNHEHRRRTGTARRPLTYAALRGGARRCDDAPRARPGRRRPHGSEFAAARDGHRRWRLVFAIIGLALGIAAGLVLDPTVPAGLQPYLPIAVVAALDALFGALRAYLDGVF